MKKFLLFLTLFLSAVGIATAEVQATIDLTAQGWTTSTSVADQTLTIGTCKAVFATNGGSTAPTYYTNDVGNAVRMYTKNTLTISAPDNYYITEIIVTGVSNSSKNCSFDNFALNSETEKGSLTIATDKKSGTWVCGSDKPSSVAFKSNTSKKQVWVQTISITIEPLASDPTDCGLKFAAETANVTFGTTPYTLPSLTNPNGVTVKWSSSDENVAKFDAENNIEIRKAGTTIIKAELADEGTAYTKNTSASYTLTVAKGTPTFAYASATYDYVMQAGGADFSAPALNNPNKLAVTYESDNTEVATVDENTGVITPVTRGQAVITATGAENDCWKSATATLTVNITKNIPVLTFSNTEVTKYIDELSAYKGQTLKTDPAGLEITYSVSPADIASINSKSGELTFTGATGVATITAVSTETTTHESKSATYTVSVSKRNPALAFDETTIELSTNDTYAGQAVKYTLLEGLAEDFTINYETNNSSVANVNALTGAVTLTGAEGTATITAYGSGNTYYTDGSATYTIKVAKQYIWSDTKAVLVTKYSDLKAGDVIAIGHWSNTQSLAMTNSTSNDYLVSEEVTYNSDHSEMNLTNTVLLMQLEEVTINGTKEWGLKTLNFDGEQGYIGGSAKGKSNVQTTANDAHSATITISEGTTKILFTGSWELRCNTGSNPARFATYAGSVQPVYIYKVVTPKTIVNTEADPEDVNYECLDENGNGTLCASSTFFTESTATEYVVKINGVKIEFATVDASTDGIREVKLEGLPYIPGAEFTIAPVINGVEGHSEVLGITIPTLPVVDFSANNSVLYFDAEKYATAEKCNLDAWTYLTVNFKETAGSGNYLDENDVRRNLALNFEEFGKNEKQLIGWYDENKDQVQWCQYNFMEVSVVAGKPQITLGAVKPIGELTLNAYFTFNVAPEYASLIATPGSLSAPARLAEGSVVQKVAGNTITVTDLTWPTNADALVSGVESVVVEGVDGAVEYYNMQGVRVEGELAPGMYIRRQGRSVSKVQIR